MKNVKVIFDRRKTVAKTGIGTIDICVYLKEGQRKFESVGSATPEEWEVVAQDREIQAKIKHYEQIINAMLVLGEEMTIEEAASFIHISHVLPTASAHLIYKDTLTGLSTRENISSI